MSDFARQVEELRPQLMRFARAQLRNDAWAEDAVSDTVLAALEKPQSFAGGSQLKTWLVGILKHKLIDQLRRHTREVASSPDDDSGLEDLVFAPDGHFRDREMTWGNPESSLQEQQFFVVLQACVENLPASQARVFMMREWLELEAEEICKEMCVSSTNLWVLLHRARLRLRECLQAKWFATRH
jgi:RNA polymerase sigma-70 factor (TIGR02943 family)